MQTSSRIGGVETWLDRTNAHLSKSGFEVTVGLAKGLRYNDPESYRQAHPDLTTVDVDGRGLNRDGRVRALMRCIRSVRPDIVVPLGIVDANEATIRCKQQSINVRLVAHAQGNLPTMLADLNDYRDWIDRVVCPGRLTRKVLVQWAGFLPDRVINIPNGADPVRIAQQPRLPGMPLRIGYVGRLTPLDKRATDLIGLHRELESLGVDYTLDIVGDGPCGEQIRAALGGQAPRVQIHGAVPHDELYASVFPNLDVLVLTSASEAFGIVLVEAMMHGVVPVSSRYDGFHAERLVEDELNGLSYPVGDMRAAALAIARLAGDTALLHQLSSACLAKSAEYTWARSLERWQCTLEEVIAAPLVLGSKPPVMPASPVTGFLDRIGIPAGLSDVVRRTRRTILGSSVPAGGEEWPLYYRHHDAATLDAIQTAINQMDVVGTDFSMPAVKARS